MIEKTKPAHEKERPENSDAGVVRIMGVSTDEITEAMIEAAWSAQRLHEFHGVPLVIWRDGKVVEVSPAEFKTILEDGQRIRADDKVR
jgi:hypothetical protein